MFSTSIAILLAAIQLVTTATAGPLQNDGWHFDTAFVLVNEELDPIVSPNMQSSHMHKVLGESPYRPLSPQTSYSSSISSRRWKQLPSRVQLRRSPVEYLYQCRSTGRQVQLLATLALLDRHSDQTRDDSIRTDQCEPPVLLLFEPQQRQRPDHPFPRWVEDVGG
jgi:hypothetical protein